MTALNLLPSQDGGYRSDAGSRGWCWVTGVLSGTQAWGLAGAQAQPPSQAASGQMHCPGSTHIECLSVIQGVRVNYLRYSLNLEQSQSPPSHPRPQSRSLKHSNTFHKKLDTFPGSGPQALNSEPGFYLILVFENLSYL